MLMSATVIGTVVAKAAAMSSAPPMSEAVLTAIALIVAVTGILLRLSAAGNECGKAADFLPAFLSAGARLLVWLRLMLRRTVVHLLVTRRKRLRVARQIRLLLGFARRIAGFILAHERLGLVVAVVETLLIALLLLSARRSLLRLLVVVRILLTELLLRRGDKTEIMFGMLVVIFRGHRVAGSLRVARKLDVFFRYMRSCAADFDIRPV